MTDLTIDDNGFLRVDRAKAPFKFDPESGTIEFVEKNPRRRLQSGQRKVSVTLAQLAELSQSGRDQQFRSSPQEQAEARGVAKPSP